MKRRSFLKATAVTVAASPVVLNADSIVSTRVIKTAKEQERIDSPEIENANHIYLRTLSGTEGFRSQDNFNRDNIIKLLVAYPLRIRPANTPLFNKEEKKMGSLAKEKLLLERIIARYNKETRYVEIFLPNDTQYRDMSRPLLTTIYLSTVLKALTITEAKAFKGIISEQSKRLFSFLKYNDSKYTNLLSKNIEEHKDKDIDSKEFPSFIEYVEFHRANAITDSRALVSTKNMTKEQKLMLTSTYEDLKTFKDGKYIADMLNLNIEDQVFSGLVIQKAYQHYLKLNENIAISNSFLLLLINGLRVNVEASINPITEEDKLAVSEFKLDSLVTHFNNVVIFIE